MNEQHVGIEKAFAEFEREMAEAQNVVGRESICGSPEVPVVVRRDTNGDGTGAISILAK